ncbi:hypothetical protein EYF80_012263 [Liparis tanakae]|uniref:Uncharacterized protein n=1 Tax=Liparis tanakae TaxID=230148 RepID=A0A4Z2IHG3_9TELE|nr:hypothetical protein EYF80_012263 [Liparis tanakae]
MVNSADFSPLPAAASVSRSRAQHLLIVAQRVPRAQMGLKRLGTAFRGLWWRGLPFQGVCVQPLSFQLKSMRPSATPGSSNRRYGNASSTPPQESGLHGGQESQWSLVSSTVVQWAAGLCKPNRDEAGGPIQLPQSVHPRGHPSPQPHPPHLSGKPWGGGGW